MNDFTSSWERHKQNIIRAVKRTQAWAKQDLKDSISNPFPPASQPGEAPHMRTAQLLNSIQDEYFETDKTAGFEIASSAPHSIFLEYGTAKMRPRPFVQPAIKRAQLKLKEYLKHI